MYTNPAKQYVEPFAGSAALFFSLNPSSAVLADLNGHLVNALRQLKADPTKLYDHLVSIPRDSSTYYEKRNRLNELRGDDLEAAVLFVYLNRNCFNGLWRTNKLGHFNVPYGGEEMGAIPPLTLLAQCASALQQAEIRHQDFRQTISDAGSDAFIYADPPYFTAKERTFIEYGQKSFGKDDLADLLSCLKRAAAGGATVVLTYRDGEELPGLPPEWNRTTFEVTRNVGGFKDYRRKQMEVIYTNAAIEMA